MSQSVIDALHGDALTEALAAQAADGDEIDEEALVADIGEFEDRLEQLAKDYYAEGLIGRAEYLAARNAVEAKLKERRNELIAARYSLPAFSIDGGQVMTE